MLGSIGKALSAVKNGAIEAGARAYLNSKISRFGSVTRLEIDRQRRTAAIEVELKGEVSPITVRVGSYDVVERNGGKYVTVRDVRASREWIGLAVEQYLAGRETRIPETVSAVI